MENKREVVEAEYKVVKERTLEVIAIEIKTIDNHIYQVALNGAVEIGKRLVEAKGKLGHGNWENWCKDNLNYTPSWAAKLMKISTEYGIDNSPYLAAISKTDTCADLSISKAFRLLQVPEDKVENFAEKNEIADMTVKELEEEIRRLKDDKEVVSKRLEEIESEKELIQQGNATLIGEKKELKEKIEGLESRSKEEGGEDEKQRIAEAIKESKELLKAKEKKIEAEQKKAQVLQDKLDKFEEDKAEAIDEARALAEREAKEKATLESKEVVDKLLLEVEMVTAEKENALKRAEAANNETIMKFKILIDDIQDNHKEALELLEIINQENEERGNKMYHVLAGLYSNYNAGILEIFGEVKNNEV